MNPKSMAPKNFVEENDMSNKEGKQNDDGWLKCVIDIRKVGPCVQWKKQTNNNRSRHRNDQADDDGLCVMMEVHLLLLTGRTHQVRGQMAAMNMPLVGDPLYGVRMASLTKIDKDNIWYKKRHRDSTKLSTTKSESSNSNNNSNESLLLALQCCTIRFPKPEWACNTTATASTSTSGVRLKTSKEKDKNQKNTKKKRRPMLVESHSSLLSFHLDEAWWTNEVEHLRTP